MGMGQALDGRVGVASGVDVDISSLPNMAVNQAVGGTASEDSFPNKAVGGVMGVVSGVDVGVLLQALQNMEETVGGALQAAQRLTHTHHMTPLNQSEPHITAFNQSQNHMIPLNQSQHHMTPLNQPEPRMTPLNQSQHHMTLLNQSEPHMTAFNQSQNHMIPLNQSEPHMALLNQPLVSVSYESVKSDVGISSVRVRRQRWSRQKTLTPDTHCCASYPLAGGPHTSHTQRAENSEDRRSKGPSNKEESHTPGSAADRDQPSHDSHGSQSAHSDTDGSQSEQLAHLEGRGQNQSEQSVHLEGRDESQSRRPAQSGRSQDSESQDQSAVKEAEWAPCLFPRTRSRPPKPPSMPTLPEEDEDSPDSTSSSPTSYSPVQSKAVKVAMATPSIVLPQMAASVQPNPRPVEHTRSHSPRPRLARNSASLGVPITTVDGVYDLLKDELPEPCLSSEERQRNLQLLEEAKRVSDRFLTRRGRRSTCSLSDSPTGLSPSPTPGSSPVPSRSSSTSGPPPLVDRPEANLTSAASGQHLEVPAAQEKSEAEKVDPEVLCRVEWRPSEKRKVSSGTLAPRHTHAQTHTHALTHTPPGTLKKSASSPTATSDDSPSPSPATGVAKPVPRPPTQQAPCTAEIKTLGAFPPLMRAVSWDTVGSLGPSHMGEEPSSPLPFSKVSGYKDFPVPPVNIHKLSKLRDEHKLMRNNSISSSKLPELSETAEQERGPSPCHAPESPEEAESKEKTDVLPSISDVMLRKLKLHRAYQGVRHLSQKRRLRMRLVQLSLAYRNDSYTLETRLKQAERERNLTEDNTEKELEEFKTSLKCTACLWQSVEQREAYQRLLETVAVLQRLAVRLSSRAEMVGAVRQEKRMTKATEVMMQYVENLKRTYEKDHAELMEFKKLANQNSNRCYGGSMDTGGDDGIPRASRSMSLTMGKAMPRRRVSVAVVPKFNLLTIPGQSAATTPGQSAATTPGQSAASTPGQSAATTPATASGPAPTQGPSSALPILCEAAVRTAPPSDGTLHTPAESGRRVESDGGLAKGPSVEEIHSHLKAKIEEEAFKKGYEEGLKRSKEFQELKEEKQADGEKLREEKERERDREGEKEREKTGETEDKLLPGQRDEEAHTHKKSSRGLWELWSGVERWCPGALWRHRVVCVVCAALIFLLTLLLLTNLLGFLSNASSPPSDTTNHPHTHTHTHNKLFPLNKGNAKQPSPRVTHTHTHTHTPHTHTSAF
ncbi:hypothetical protein ACEWY4_027576 [Coilia grayii]|uniref:Protein MRVI1-like n=1 Tax=Coilia grayii TaxID=363190 RepID=A0ABD1IPA4_9TELE